MRLRFRDCVNCAGSRNRGDAIGRFAARRGRDERRVPLAELMRVNPPPDPLALGNLPSDDGLPEMEDGASRDGALVASYPRGYTARRGVDAELNVFAPPAVSRTAMTIADIQARNRQFWEDAKPSTVADRALGAVAASEALPMATRIRAVAETMRRRYADSAS